MAFPLLTIVAQGTAQWPGGRQPLRGKFERHFVEGGEMRGVAAAKGDLGHQARGTRQHGAHRRRFAFSNLPVAIEGTTSFLDNTYAISQHHQTGRCRDDTRSCEGQWMTRQIRFGERQETTQSVIEDEHGVLTLHLNTATPAVDLAPQISRPCQLDQSALLHAAPERQQRCIEARRSGEQQRDPAPGLRRVRESEP